MNITPSEPFEKNETTYQGFNIEFGAMIWSIVVYEGKYNGIRISKVKPNPFRGPGKEFGSFKEALNHYKGKSMKQMISGVSIMWDEING